ncbi:MAG TPA: ANTAR domain-containing protein [Streptosporangiaceae bacterium]|nr:ANTAR domain-containing protein [Streptosporangiaceae bacterium]
MSVLVPGGGDVVWRTDGASARLDDLQFTLGQGPGVDAAASGELVFEADLEALPAQRWPAFTPAALELGVRAVFAVPLQIGVIRLGVVLGHRDAAGTLSSAALADLLVFASAATGALLGPLSDGPEPQWVSDQTSGYRAEVHQATGMISVQLDVTQAVALIRLRAYAFSQHRPLADVAADVVARRLRFDDNDD